MAHFFYALTFLLASGQKVLVKINLMLPSKMFRKSKYVERGRGLSLAKYKTYNSYAQTATLDSNEAKHCRQCTTVLLIFSKDRALCRSVPTSEEYMLTKLALMLKFSIDSSIDVSHGIPALKKNSLSFSWPLFIRSSGHTLLSVTFRNQRLFKSQVQNDVLTQTMHFIYLMFSSFLAHSTRFITLFSFVRRLWLKRARSVLLKPSFEHSLLQVRETLFRSISF